MERFKNQTDYVIYEVQGGFRRDRRCVDQIFVMRKVYVNNLAKCKNVYWTFMDL